MDEHTISPAGDPFHAAPDEQDQGHPCACNDGWVTIGQIAIDPETGEEAEEYALYLCHRCAEGASWKVGSFRACVTTFTTSTTG